MLPPDVHGTAMLEDNSITLESVCGSANSIFAIIPSRQLESSIAPSLAATMTKTLSSPAHLKSQELINLVISMNSALEIKDQIRDEQQAQFQETMQTFQRDQLRRDEDAKQQFQRYTKDVERQLKETQHQINMLKQERSLDQSRIKFLEDSLKEDRSRMKDLEDSQQEDRARIKDLEESLLEEKKTRMEEKEAGEREKLCMLSRIQEIEDEHIETAGWVSGAVSIQISMQ